VSTSESPALKVTSFAGKSKDLQQNTKPWNLVTACKNKNIVSVAGKVVGDGTTLKGVEPPKRDFWEVSVTRLHKSTTDDQIKTHLQTHGIEVKDVYIFNSRIKGCKSSKVRVAREHAEKIKDGNIWPMHCRVQDWIYKPKSARKLDTSKLVAEA
jgi:hypothetical protein